MIAKRFIPIFDGTDKRVVGAKDNGKIISFMDMFDLLNDLSDENEKLKSDLIDNSALISMLEDYQALKIEDTLYNLTGAKSEEEFNELYKPYLDKAKRCWG